MSFNNISKNYFFITIILIFFILTYNSTVFIALPYYFGNKFYYLLLSGLINFLLIFSFLISNYFFNIFLSVFILMGFGFKFTLSLIFNSKHMFYDFLNPLSSGVGNLRMLSQHLLQKSSCQKNSLELKFEGSNSFVSECSYPLKIIYDGDVYDKGLVVSIIALSVLLFSIIFFDWLTQKKIIKASDYTLKISDLYEKYRLLIIFALGISIILVGIVNFQLNIYQRGMKSSFDFFLLKPIVTWLLLFGFLSFVCHLLFSEYIRKTKGFLFLLPLSFLEPFISYTSMISRGFIFNAMSLFFGTLKLVKKTSIFYSMLLLFMIFSLFFLSVYLTQNNRSTLFLNNSFKITAQEKVQEGQINSKKIKIINKIEKLNINNFLNIDFNINHYDFIPQVLIERWIGLEEVIMVANHEKIGWPFLKNSFLEKQADNKLSLFDKEIYKGYLSIDRKTYNFTSIPGIIAFLYFSNSYIFLSISIFIISIFCLSIEFISRNISYGNMFFSSLIGQILAFRLIHFGVYAIETYKIILTIFLTLIISLIYSKLFFKKVK